MFDSLGTSTADGRLYFYNLKYDASQWELPISDELSEAEVSTLKNFNAAAASASVENGAAARR